VAETVAHKHSLMAALMILLGFMTPWRKGSASDSRPEGCVFKARRGQNTKSLFRTFVLAEWVLEGTNSGGKSFEI
jgi:hypothetical protein